MNSETVEYKLTRGNCETILVDAEDLHILEKHKLNTLKSERSYTKYVVCCDKQTRKYIGLLHRLILKAKPFEIVDHKNGNGLDCRKDNLRIVSGSQNQMNRRTQGEEKGVWFREDRGKWYARITFKSNPVHLGCFDTKEQAVEARQRAEEKYFGEFNGNGTKGFRL